MNATFLPLDEARHTCDEMRARSRSIALVNGCFDPLHHGHIELLRFAKTQADVLFVAINSDESIQRLKGSHRPRFHLRDRVLSLLELRSVDFVVAFNDSTAAEVIRQIRPSVVVKGGDYNKESTVEQTVIAEVGARLCFADYVAGVSSSILIERKLYAKSNGGSKVHLLADFALDTYISGHVSELSREYPHPVCVNATETSNLGGGANLAVSLKRQASTGAVIGAVGISEQDEQVYRLLLALGISELKLVRIGVPYCTCFKKVVAIQTGSTPHEILRLDQVPLRPNMGDTWDNVIAEVNHSSISGGDVIVVSAYERPDRSTVGPRVRDFLLDFAARRRARLIGACRSECRSLRGYEFIVMNEQECLQAVSMGVSSVVMTHSLLEAFGDELAPSNLIVTLGERGALVYDATNKEVHSIDTIPCPPGTDPTGAGDVFLAAFAGAISRGTSLLDAARTAVSSATSALFKPQRPAVAEHFLSDE